MNEKLILIIDDESKIRRYVSRALEKEGFDVATAADGEEGLKVIDSLLEKPDLVVVDYMMPEMDGLTFLTELRRKSQVPVIFLSARFEVSLKTKALELGADDYIVKPFSMEELIARINAILRRFSQANSFSRENILTNGPLVMNIGKRKFSYKNEEIFLADTEFRLMAVLMKKPGVVFTHEDLLRQVWGAEFIGETNYLRVSFTRIRKKMKVAGIEESLISSYSGIGYFLEDLND